MHFIKICRKSFFCLELSIRNHAIFEGGRHNLRDKHNDHTKTTTKKKVKGRLFLPLSVFLSCLFPEVFTCV